MFWHWPPRDTMFKPLGFVHPTSRIEGPPISRLGTAGVVFDIGLWCTESDNFWDRISISPAKDPFWDFTSLTDVISVCFIVIIASMCPCIWAIVEHKLATDEQRARVYPYLCCERNHHGTIGSGDNSVSCLLGRTDQTYSAHGSVSY